MRKVLVLSVAVGFLGLTAWLSRPADSASGATEIRTRDESLGLPAGKVPRRTDGEGGKHLGVVSRRGDGESDTLRPESPGAAGETTQDPEADTGDDAMHALDGAGQPGLSPSYVPPPESPGDVPAWRARQHDRMRAELAARFTERLGEAGEDPRMDALIQAALAARQEGE